MDTEGPKSPSHPLSTFLKTKVKEGKACKRTKRRWTHRWFVLGRETLISAKSPTSTVTCLIPLVMVLSCQVNEQLPEVLELVLAGFGDQTHKYWLRFSDAEECKEWWTLLTMQSKVAVESHASLRDSLRADSCTQGFYWRNVVRLSELSQVDTKRSPGELLTSQAKHSLASMRSALSRHLSSPQTRPHSSPRVGPQPGEDIDEAFSSGSGESDAEEQAQPSPPPPLGKRQSFMNSLASSLPTSLRRLQLPHSGSSSHLNTNRSPKDEQDLLALHAKARGTLHLSGILKVKEAMQVGLPGNKIRASVQRWHKRYFALYDEVLMSYKSKGGDEAGGLLLTSVTAVVPLPPTATSCCFNVQYTDQNSQPITLALQAKTPAESQEWVTAIKSLATQGTMPEREDATDGDGSEFAVHGRERSRTQTVLTGSPILPKARAVGSGGEEVKILPSTAVSTSSDVNGINPAIRAALEAEIRRQILAEEGGSPREGQVFLASSSLSEAGFVVDTDKDNQDYTTHRLNVADDPAKALFVVCDGHGPEGHHVSSFVGESLVKRLSEAPLVDQLPIHPAQAIRAAFADTAKALAATELDVQYSGSTALLLYFDGPTLYSCNVGDCRAVLGKRMDVWDCSTVPLSCDHKPSRPDEKKRIEAAGGRCEPKRGVQGAIGSARVWLKDQDVPGLAVSRAFGDSVAAAVGVMPEPEIWRRHIQTNDAIVVMASDGVWEFISSEEAIDIVAQTGNPEEACQHLVEEAKKRWAQEDWEARDDITCTVIFF